MGWRGMSEMGYVTITLEVFCFFIFPAHSGVWLA
jgi:energy-converting hydrogenase Eha subunit G